MSQHILIVDDNSSVRQLLESIVMQAGYTFRSVASGFDALEYLESGIQKPDLIISDYNMPKMTGLQLLRSIGENPGLAEIPFILMTGADLEEKQALRAGCAGFLQKPFDVGKLEELVKQLLQK